MSESARCCSSINARNRARRADSAGSPGPSKSSWRRSSTPAAMASSRSVKLSNSAGADSLHSRRASSHHSEARAVTSSNRLAPFLPLVSADLLRPFDPNSNLLACPVPGSVPWPGAGANSSCPALLERPNPGFGDQFSRAPDRPHPGTPLVDSVRNGLVCCGNRSAWTGRRITRPLAQIYSVSNHGRMPMPSLDESGRDVSQSTGKPSRWLEKLGLHRPELRAWAMYDWANSAMVTSIVTAIFPIYYSSVACKRGVFTRKRPRAAIPPLP